MGGPWEDFCSDQSRRNSLGVRAPLFSWSYFWNMIPASKSGLASSIAVGFVITSSSVLTGLEEDLEDDLEDFELFFLLELFEPLLEDLDFLEGMSRL